MKRILSYLTLSVLAIGAATAAPVSPEQALARVQDSGNLPQTVATRGMTPRLSTTFTTADGEAALYIFDKGDQDGFLIVSADDVVPALLGYADNGYFDVDNMPPAMEYWLDEYTRQIEFARTQIPTITIGDVNTRVTLPEWPSISPLVKTQWNQGTPYNSLCPYVSGTIKAATGCVATSMAQVMNYFKYPEKGQGSISYKAMQLNRTLSMNFANVTFDWANMANTYVNGSYTGAQATAVATLMQACGYSVEMDYWTESGAVNGEIPKALVTYFNYDQAACALRRSNFTYSEWASMIYDNLKNIGPVIIGAQGPGGGHSFVCDGYSSNGYFHINWGWAGMSDGYFLLDALNPPGIGVGGGGGEFYYDQEAVFKIQPPKSGTEAAVSQINLNGSVKGSASGGYLYFNISGNSYPGFQYFGDSSMVFNVGCIIQPANNPNATPTYKQCTNNSSFNNSYLMPLKPGYVIQAVNSIPRFTASNLGLSDGVKYKLTLAYNPNGTNQWYPVVPSVGSYNYFYVTKSGSTYTFENFDQMQFDCTNLALASQLYDGNAAKFNITLVNNNDTELTRGVILVLTDRNKNVVYQGGNALLESLSPGETFQSEITTPLTRIAPGRLTAATDFYMGLYDTDTNTLYYSSPNTVTMNPNPGEPVYKLTFKIDNGELNKGTYIVKNSNDIQTSSTVSVTSGFFTKQIILYNLYVQSTSGTQSTLGILGSVNLPLSILSAGETITIPYTFSYPSAIPGYIYYFALSTTYGQIDNTTLTGYSALDNSGVESLFGEDGNKIVFIHNRAGASLDISGGEGGIKSVEAYYLNGMKAPVNIDRMGGNARVDLSELGKGVIVVTAVDEAGNRETTKIAL